LYVANEGRFVAFVAGKDGKRAVEIMRRYPQGLGAVVIGEVAASGKAAVTMKNRIGSSRIVDMLSGEQLPRIC
jgi:hydrogenase expression/formation protein HypE